MGLVIYSTNPRREHTNTYTHSLSNHSSPRKCAVGTRRAAYPSCGQPTTLHPNKNYLSKFGASETCCQRIIDHGSSPCACCSPTPRSRPPFLRTNQRRLPHTQAPLLKLWLYASCLASSRLAKKKKEQLRYLDLWIDNSI